MHADDPRYQYRVEREKLADYAEDGKMKQGDLDAIVEVLDVMDPEAQGSTFVHGDEKKELATSSLKIYSTKLRQAAEEMGGGLLDKDTESVVAFARSLKASDDPDHELAAIAPKGGYSKSSIGQFESALKAFYRFHEGHDVDPEEIPSTRPDPSKVDERDLWTVDEVEALRAHITSKRDEALFELLAYTGQRIRVIQTLRVKDVEPDTGDTGRYYVNEEVEGRKNRDGHGPLLGARGAVRRWLEVHPTKGEPGHADDALITATRPRRNAEPGDRLNQNTIRYDILQPLAERAGVDKDIHPHMFRHYFTTVALRPKERGGFGMDPQYVKRLRGDAPGSTVMETTYAHLIDEDASAHAEAAYTGSEPATALTPAAPCGNCGANLDAGQPRCHVCGTPRTPDAEKSEVEELREQLEQERQAREEMMEKVEALLS